MMTVSPVTGNITFERKEPLMPAFAPETIASVNRELMREFENMLETLVLATEGDDRARMAFVFERLKGRYLKVLQLVRIDTKD